MIKKNCNIGKRLLSFYSVICRKEKIAYNKYYKKINELADENIEINRIRIWEMEREAHAYYVSRRMFEHFVLGCIKKEHKEKFEEIKRKIENEKI